ncbi:MAG: hypothetical protein V1656_00065 [Candidatus Jorgensenbacteria bacterium]
MKLNIKISKIANFFFFVTNLSEWHFSCRTSYNEAWIKKMGPLNGEEAKALATFKPIMRKYGFVRRPQNKKGCYLGEFFYTGSSTTVWKRLAVAVTKNEYVAIRKIFATFSQRFEKVWAGSKDGRVDVFKGELEKRNNKNLFNDTEAIFGTSYLSTKINVVVLFSPLGINETAAGSANLGAGYCSLELPKLKAGTWQLHYSIGILAHEIAHSLFASRGGLKLIRRAMREKNLRSQIRNISMNTISLLNEIIVASFVPLGYFGMKYFGAILTPLSVSNLKKGRRAEKTFKEGGVVGYYHQLEHYFVPRCFSLASSYGKMGKPLDVWFVKGIASVLKNLTQEKRGRR